MFALRSEGGKADCHISAAKTLGLTMLEVTTPVNYNGSAPGDSLQLNLGDNRAARIR